MKYGCVRLQCVIHKNSLLFDKGIAESDNQVSSCTSVCLSALKKTRLTPDNFFLVEVCIDDYYWNLCTYRPIWLESEFKVIDTLPEDRRAFVKTTLHLRFIYSTRNQLPNSKEWFVLCKMWKGTSYIFTSSQF